jgi:hypothetical protein
MVGIPIRKFIGYKRQSPVPNQTETKKSKKDDVLLALQKVFMLLSFTH